MPLIAARAPARWDTVGSGRSGCRKADIDRGPISGRGQSVAGPSQRHRQPPAYVVEKLVWKKAVSRRIRFDEGSGFGHFLDVGGSDGHLFDQCFAI